MLKCACRSSELMNQIDRQTRVSTRDVMITYSESGYPDSRVNKLPTESASYFYYHSVKSCQLHPYQVESLINSELMHVLSKFIFGTHITTSNHFSSYNLCKRKTCATRLARASSPTSNLVLKVTLIFPRQKYCISSAVHSHRELNQRTCARRVCMLCMTINCPSVG